jgi:hypothetical protein
MALLGLLSSRLRMLTQIPWKHTRLILFWFSVVTGCHILFPVRLP